MSHLTADARADWRPLHSIIVPSIFAMVIALECRWASGDSLGFFFGPMLLLTLVTPALLLAVQGMVQRLCACGVLAIVVGGVWLIGSGVETSSTLRCAVVLAAWTIALAGAATGASRVGMPPVLAAALVVVLGLAWLTWPVWLSAELPTTFGAYVLRWCAPVHPIFAINGVLRARFDAWDRYRLAYQQLTTLNQDVFYSLPRSVGGAVVLHSIFGFAMMGIASLRGAKRK